MGLQMRMPYEKQTWVPVINPQTQTVPPVISSLQMQAFQGISLAEFKVTVLTISQLVIFTRIDYMLFSLSAALDDLSFVGQLT